MLQKRAAWLCLLFLGEMFTASAMQHFENELEKAIVADTLHSSDHEFRRQFRLAGDIA